MPCELWDIFQENRHLLHDLPALGASVIQQWIRTKYGASALIMVVPHTFGGDLKFNCHLHVLISAGGLEDATGRWISKIHFNKNAVMKMWRHAVIDHLRRAIKAGVLKLRLTVQETQRLLATAYYSERHPRWIVLWDDIVSKSYFLRYAARYVRRPPIAMWRILKVIEGRVKFVAKDTRNKKIVPIWSSLDRFVRLLAAHTADQYHHAIRYFGLLAPGAKSKLEAGVYLAVGQQQRSRPSRVGWRELTKRSFGIDPMIDSFGQEMHWV